MKYVKQAVGYMSRREIWAEDINLGVISIILKPWYHQSMSIIKEKRAKE